jgi:two-component system cell cycle sensor histidine kinase/response regulator CckA
LRLAGYEVLSCQQGDEAVDLLEARGGSIQLLVTDVNLGAGMDGFEAAALLRSRFPSLRVLYMSGEEEADRHGDRAAGGSDRFILKPFTPRAFTDAVREMLSPVNARAVS